MSTETIIRAWKDEEYRASLSEAERALLPDHPAGLIELADTDLDQVTGGLHRPQTGPTCLQTCTVKDYEQCCC
jgi:mersacidin/lichenicidin family type 2 lantibiotic